ncbi:MAG: cation:proton antiporter [Verrucomicrobia bacterium]|nr:cation:proton antiporter [Verrucomicrobiota bacterium]
MNPSDLTIPILASGGGHGYLYGLFFLILALIIGAAARHFLHKVPLPFTVLLMLIGLGLGFPFRGDHGGGAHAAGHGAGHDGFFAKLLDAFRGSIEWGANLDPHLILYVFLPILIFEAAYALDVHVFKKSFWNAFYMAGPGIVTATLMTGGCIIAIYSLGWGLTEWNVSTGELGLYLAMLFGAVASATDPVAVVALLKELGASKKLGTLIEGESLLNDGTAIVAFVVLIGAVTGASMFSAGSAVSGFFVIGLGGAVLGILVGLVGVAWVKRVFNDPHVETSVMLMTAYLVFYACEHLFGMSGVLGLVTLGLVWAGIGRTRISPEVQHFMHEFWEFAAFVANVVIFIVVGVVIAMKVHPEPIDYLVLALVYVVIHLVRFVNIGLLYPIMRKTGYGLPKKDAVVVWWGALRGAIGLALALVVYGQAPKLEFEVGKGKGGHGYTTESKVFFVDADGNREEWEGATLTLAAANGEGHAEGHAEGHEAGQAGGAIVGLAIGAGYDVTPFDEDAAKLAAERERLANGNIVIEGAGSGAVIEAKLLGISKRIRDQFLFLISGIVLLTLLVNATTIKFLVNGLGLTRIPAVKAKMMTATSASIVKNCENEMDVLKSDSFLGGANWSRVREFLPEPIVITDVEGDPDAIDTVAETRRRILEKESSSYWKQNREGLLGAAGVNQLYNNIKELIDLGGKVPLSDRDYLDHIWQVPKWMESLKGVPGFKRIFMDRLATTYESAKSFVIAQEEVAKLVDSLVANTEGDIGKQAADEKAKQLKGEIMQNRLRGLNFLRDMRENYPELIVGIETKDAARSVLNHERNTIKNLKAAGTIELDEADRMIVDVEGRMKDIMDRPLVLRLPEPEEVLREVTWLKGLSEDCITKIIELSNERTYQSGDMIMEQGDRGDGMILITRGSVKISIMDTVVDILGRGSVIGEMAVLAGVPRTADVIADTTVTALWMRSTEMNEAMAESPALAKGLWETAGRRFTENLLKSQEPYLNLSQWEFRRWLSGGEVVTPAAGDSLDLYGKVAILLSGSATVPGADEPLNAITRLNAREASFGDGARVWVRSES